MLINEYVASMGPFDENDNVKKNSRVKVEQGQFKLQLFIFLF